jgi:hypothetical protein
MYNMRRLERRERGRGRNHSRGVRAGWEGPEALLGEEQKLGEMSATCFSGEEVL